MAVDECSDLRWRNVHIIVSSMDGCIMVVLDLGEYVGMAAWLRLFVGDFVCSIGVNQSRQALVTTASKVLQSHLRKTC
jgi:hypothetical protein